MVNFCIQDLCWWIKHILGCIINVVYMRNLNFEGSEYNVVNHQPWICLLVRSQCQEMTNKQKLHSLRNTSCKTITTIFMYLFQLTIPKVKHAKKIILIFWLFSKKHYFLNFFEWKTFQNFSIFCKKENNKNFPLKFLTQARKGQERE